MSGSSKQKTDQSSTQNPWGPQATYLEQAFGQGATNLGNANANSVAPTGFTAGMTPDQLATFHSMVGYGNNSNIAGQTAGIGGASAAAGANATNGALSGLMGFDPSASNNMDAITAGGNAYAAKQDIPGQVAAAMRDATQQANDVTIPGQGVAAAATGNTNSSRAGIADGLVQRGLAQKAGDLSATLRANAFNTGAGLASNTAQSNNAARLGSLGTLGSLGGGATATGLSGLSGSIGDQGNLFNIANMGGAGQQAGQQATFDNQNQAYNFNQNAGSQALDNFMKTIGSNNWGGTSTGTSTQTSTPSMWQVIGGLMNSAGSLMGGMNKSDRRVKKDIVRIGTLDNGLPVYRFRYIGQPDNAAHTIGLMAQDVEKVNPNAVAEFGGIKHVDYELASQTA